MRLSPRTLLLLLYTFLFIMAFSQVFSQVPVTRETLPYVLGFLTLFITGLALILGWDYIIPRLFRSFCMFGMRVVEGKYIVCRYRGSPELVGYVMLKVVPSMPIADMPKERRESLLHVVQGLLAGAQYEVILAYVGVRDRYHYNVVKRLEEEKQARLALAFRETPAVREAIRQIDVELQILRQVPVILEGFYIALVRDYAMDEEELKLKLDADARSISSKRAGMSVEARVVEGEELRSIASYFFCGSLPQATL